VLFTTTRGSDEFCLPLELIVALAVSLNCEIQIDFGGVLKQASLAYVPEAGVGDYVIVHVGFALSRVDEEEANKIFGYLKAMEELGELEAPSQ